MVFRDRADAGRCLAARLAAYRRKHPIVYALPRGGVVVGHEVAKALNAEMDLLMVQKIGHPSAPEYAIGAVADDGDYIQDPAQIGVITRNWFLQARLVESQVARKRRKLYLSNRRPIPAAGRVAIIVDDGLSTGITMALAIHEARHQNPAKIVVAVPVAPRDVAAELRRMADDVVVLYSPRTEFGSLAPFYKRFEPVTDDKVIELIQDVLATAS
jgi:predicted phosphoribosyltransferase